MKKITVVVDVECYKNYFLVVCKSTEGTVFKISMFNDVIDGNRAQLKKVLATHRIVTFNGSNYDLPMLYAFLSKKFNNSKLHQLSTAIITSDKPWWMLSKGYGFSIPYIDHIDLMGCTPLQASLKMYGSRIKFKKLQDLPIEPNAIISGQNVPLLEKYCLNDVEVTTAIMWHLRDQLKLRVDIGDEYGFDARSMSDAQIAEAILRHEMNQADHPPSKRTTQVESFTFAKPSFLAFESDVLNDVLDRICGTTFTIEATGYVKLPKHLEVPIEFNGAKYKMGIGGLHSQEKKQVVIPRDDELFGEFDVASMYPSIILGQQLYPEHLDPIFCDIYKAIYDKRLEAKAAGDKVTADTYKIVLNASYGKFGSKYSFLYSPQLLVQTTLTGQLALLMLIERMAKFGVMSANTDGINVLLHKNQWDAANKITSQWERDTTYKLEWTEYAAQYSRDVNSYICFKPDGSLKCKGGYEYGNIRKGHSNEICIDAVINYLRLGTEIEDTIFACQDVTKFLTIRGVRGGGKWRGTVLGKVVRWYLSTDGEPIRYVKNDNKVAGSDGAMPMMDITHTLPGDMDYGAYITKAKKLLTDLGVEYENN